MTDLFVQPDAEADLEDIRAYIAADSPMAADRVLERLGTVIDSLTMFPERYRPRSELDFLRLAPSRPYVVAYRYHPDTDLVVVLRMLHGARDLPSTLQP